MSKTAVKRSKAAASKANAKRTAQPGIIGYIMSQLCNARDTNKPITAQQILAQCAKKFPDRGEVGMFVTVRAQLHRLPSEREFGIDKQRDGRTVLYAAAADAVPTVKRGNIPTVRARKSA